MSWETKGCCREVEKEVSGWEGGFNNFQPITLEKSWVVSLHIMGNQLKAFLKPSVYHSTIVLRGLRGTLNWAPIMPRDTSILANYNLVLCWFCSRVGAECPLCVGMTLGEIACQRHMKARASGVTISPKPSLPISLIIPPVFRKQPIDTWTTLVGNLWNFD